MRYALSHICRCRESYLCWSRGLCYDIVYIRWPTKKKKWVFKIFHSLHRNRAHDFELTCSWKPTKWITLWCNERSLFCNRTLQTAMMNVSRFCKHTFSSREKASFYADQLLCKRSKACTVRKQPCNDSAVCTASRECEHTALYKAIKVPLDTKFPFVGFYIQLVSLPPGNWKSVLNFIYVLCAWSECMC